MYTPFNVAFYIAGFDVLIFDNATYSRRIPVQAFHAEEHTEWRRAADEQTE